MQAWPLSQTTDVFYYTKTINSDYQGDRLRNWAEISSADNPLDLDDEDSTPNGNNLSEPGETDDLDDDNTIDEDGKDGGDEDDHDPAEIMVEQIFDLALRKTVSTATPAPFFQGSTVTFRLTVFNQGTLDATNVQISDYIPNGLILADANWSESGGIATLNTPIALLEAGATTQFEITFTVDENFQETVVRNWAEISYC